MASLLDQSVIDVIECTEAADALFQAGRRSPDLILLSLALRTVSACDFITTVRSHDGVPVLLGVGDGETELVGRGCSPAHRRCSPIPTGKPTSGM